MTITVDQIEGTGDYAVDGECCVPAVLESQTWNNDNDAELLRRASKLVKA